MTRSIDPGHGSRPGATWVGDAVNFAVHAPYAEAVELCLFEAAGEYRLVLPGKTGTVHHGSIAGLKAGQEYGFRVHGRWEPAAGIFSNPAKLLIDPYARVITGELIAHPSLSIHRPRAEARPDERDNAAFVPRSVLSDSDFDWDGDSPPNIPWSETIIYETHLRGLTMGHPGVPPELRGTYAGLVTEPIIEHLQALGATAVELLPVQASVTEPWLQRRGLTNYWGYSTAGFFAPQRRYAASSDPVNEWKSMVRVLHRKGFEVILDVVYNHTAEGNHLGPTLSFRGLDNPGFYRLDPQDRRRYIDWTGTGNTVDLNSPWPLMVVMDSLRYWVEEMHVDGFRFDLATTLGRSPVRFEVDAPFFREIHQDPVLRRVKLIAEPWDNGPDGYRVGGFPGDWSGWNGRYRDDLRDFWRGHEGMVDDLAYRLTGSSDLFGARGPRASVNFVTCHDGFTLADLVSYNHKHNQPNGEHNRDGATENRSWNSGTEGDTDSDEVRSLRRRRAGSLLASLLLSQGVPMMLGGDEFGRTQRGNNNAYCQDNDTSWYDWEGMDWQLVSLVQSLTALRREHPQLRRPEFPDGHHRLNGRRDVVWFRSSGAEMTDRDWTNGPIRSLAVLIDDPEREDPIEAFYMMFNANPESEVFALPAGDWELVLSTGDVQNRDRDVVVESFTVSVMRGRP
ncbi:MAG: glycogen debranching protein GlgX [Acidimicrobiia bacterium]